MIKVGITGGIGSGKTTVCKIFELLGIPVFYADIEAKKLMVGNSTVRASIIAVFGEEVYSADGELNRVHISNVVFKDAEKLTLLNGIVHPAVKEAFFSWAEQQKSPYVLKEAALLFESQSYRDNDYNILVSSDIETRIGRVMKRDNTSREKVLDRISKQLPEEEKAKLSDFIIYNDDSNFLIKQVLAFHHKILND